MRVVWLIHFFSSIKFEFGIDNTVGGRIIFAAAVDFTIFGKRLYLGVNINLRNPAAAVKETSSKGVENYKVRKTSRKFYSLLRIQNTIAVNWFDIYYTLAE